MVTLNGAHPITHFPNGESCVNTLNFVRNTNLNFIELRYESDTDLFDLLLLKKAIDFPVALKIYYMPYSRMDRRHAQYAFTLKSVCEYINWLDFTSVIVYEPHSDVTPALLNNVITVNLIPDLLRNTDFDPERDAVLFPDSNAYKRYSDQVQGRVEIVGFKKRDFVTGKITGMDLNVPEETLLSEVKRVFIIDDLVSKGGTAIRAALEVKKLLDAEVNLVVAHCEENIFNGEILSTDTISHVWTTPTIIVNNRKKEKLHIIDILTSDWDL